MTIFLCMPVCLCVCVYSRYDRNKLLLKEIHNVQYVSCMNPTAGSFTINPRLQVNTHAAHSQGRRIGAGHRVLLVMQPEADLNACILSCFHHLRVSYRFY